MSTTDSPTRPSPWLSLILPLVVSMVTAALSFAVQWGTLGADVRHLQASNEKQERAATAVHAAAAALQIRVAAVETEGTGTRRQMETELAGVRRELERMARALEKLTDEQPRPAHYRR